MWFQTYELEPSMNSIQVLNDNHAIGIHTYAVIKFFMRVTNKNNKLPQNKEKNVQ